MYHIFGHTSPDTDAFASAFVMAYYLNAQDIHATAYRLGKPNPETAFMIEHLSNWFADEMYRLDNDLLPYLDPNNPLTTLTKGDKIGLTDHNEQTQSIANLFDFDICFIIDHHKLNLSTPTTAYVRIAPVGCTCTILYEMLVQKSITITPFIATLMLFAIISDTLNLTGPTTTDDDKYVLKKLLKIIGLSKNDQDKLAEQMFLAKSNIHHLSAREILLMDYKEYNFGDKKWGIAGIETMDISQILARCDELAQMAHTLQKQKNLDHFMVAIANIKDKIGYALTHDAKQDAIISKVFNAVPKNGLFILDGIVSRKKQIVPLLENHYHHSSKKYLTSEQ
ncbi:DHH family phosphoesterase [Moraxella sp. Pampa]|uniref:DHH family phosphoesterase n=1 Tax=Moraxella sp. Pampa TaxID=3111978 RepID=UPI002B417820|nr:DHHA2 domain-containing protein [Moraxella sp. Pampa]